MKTKELIRQLQEVDPTGEMDCVVDNIDITGVHQEPAYWDGCKQVLKWNNDRLVGAEYSSEGDKLNIDTWSISDVFVDYPDLPVKVIDTFVTPKLQERVDFWRKEAKDIIAEVEKITGKEHRSKKR